MMMPPERAGVDSPPPARRPSRYESQKRRDWQTFTRYLGAHRPPLQLRRCSGAHVLEFLRYLDRFGKTRVHAPPCPAYGGGGRAAQAEAACQCPLRQAWGSLDALVGRLRAAFDERHGARGGRGTAAAATAQQAESGGATATTNANPFAARAVRLYLRDVRDAQARARGISYSRKKKRRASKQQQQQANGRAAGGGGASTTAASEQDRDAAAAAVGCARPHGNVVVGTAPLMSAAAEPPPAPQPYVAGVPFECCEYYAGVIGGPTAANTGVAGFYLPLLFNSFG